jgi:molecular chaperone GrpE (heat shock protein)
MSGMGPDRWTETRETLTELIEWLDDARRWAETAAGHEPLDEEARQAAQAFQSNEPPQNPLPHPPWLDLHDVVAELTALRQEVKLQARSARQDRELSAKTVEHITGALAQLERCRADESARHNAVTDEARRGTTEVLVDLHDALSRSAVEADHVARASIESIHALRARLERRVSAGQSSASSIGGTAIDKLRAVFARFRRPRTPADSTAGETPASITSQASNGGASDLGESFSSLLDDLVALAARLDGLTAGYALGLSRIERALAEFEIVPIEALGQAVDPEQMEVVQSVCDPARPPGIVMAEVRRGYRRQGRIMRFAQVVVNRTST